MNKPITNTNIPRKWEWITKILEKAGFKDLAKQSREIDALLAKIYGKHEHTSKWLEAYSDLKGFSLDELGSGNIYSMSGIINEPAFCTACLNHRDEHDMLDCENCSFAMEAGGDCCDDEDSKNGIFFKFHDAFDNYGL